MSDFSDFVNSSDSQPQDSQKSNPPASGNHDLAHAGTDGASLVEHLSPERRRETRQEYEELYGASAEEWATNEVALLDEEPDESPTVEPASATPVAPAKPYTPKTITTIDGKVLVVHDPNAPLRIRDRKAWVKAITLAEQVVIHCLRLPTLFQAAERMGLSLSLRNAHRHLAEVFDVARALVAFHGIAIIGSDWRGMLEQYVRLQHAAEPSADHELTLQRVSLFTESAEASPFTDSFFDRVFGPPPEALSIDTGRQLLSRFVYESSFHGEVNDALRANKDPGLALAALNKLVQKGQALLQDVHEPFITPEEFMRTDYKLDWLVPKILVAGQPAVVGGPSKAMKTSVMIDLAVSIGAGGDTKFLGKFEVGKPGKPVGFISAESGGATIKETFLRVCQVRGVELAKCNVYPEFHLPKLSQSAEVSRLVAAVKRHGLKVLIIDPIYLSLLAGQDQRQQRQASNVFDMGPLLGDITQAFQEADCSLILVHHTVKHLPGAHNGNQFEPIDREHLAMAGFAEFARQWLLVNRREPYEDGTGLHKLWMRLGGSAGFGSLWGVDIDEGVIDENFSGRQWNVQVHTAAELKTLEHQTVQHQEQQKENAQLSMNEQKILKIMEMYPSGETPTGIRDAAGIAKKGSIMPILQKLCQEGKIEPVKVKKKSGRGFHDLDGFRLRHYDCVVGSTKEPPPPEDQEG